MLVVVSYHRDNIYTLLDASRGPLHIILAIAESVGEKERQRTDSALSRCFLASALSKTLETNWKAENTVGYRDVFSVRCTFKLQFLYVERIPLLSPFIGRSKV